MNVTLRLSKKLIGRYQKLLRSEWNERTVSEAIALIRDQLMESGLRVIFDWEKSSDNLLAKPYPISTQKLKQLADYLSKLNLELKPVDELNSENESEHQSKVARQAQVVVALLHLRREKSLHFEGETGFLRDAQSALFHGCVFEFLPELSRRGLRFAHDNLLNALYAHAMMDWTDSPSQENALKALLYNYIGDSERNENLLWAAFNGTPPTEHDFLTKAQSLWFSLMDRRDFQRAFDFLLGLYRSALPQHLNEISEMIDTTLKFAPRRSKVSA